ncbi:MAG: glycosyltransferase family 25 protein [Janthinobacterium lividum]
MLSTSAAKTLNSYFDKILILTIKRNGARRELLKQILNGLEYEVFYGVEGNTLEINNLIHTGIVDKNIDTIFIKDNIDYMNMGSNPIHINQIACSLSHVEMFKYVRDNNLSRVLILEDDIIPIEKHLTFLAETLQQMPRSWDILYLGHIYNNNFSFWGKLKYYHFTNFLYQLGIKTTAIIRKRNTYPTPYSTLLRKQGAHIGTHAYAISNEGAKKMIPLQNPLKQAAPDLMLMDAIAKRQVVSYTTKYNFFEQNSTIHSSVWDGQ